MNTLLKVNLATVLAVAPIMASAETLTDVTNTIGSLIGLATPIVVALALVYFFYSLGTYILASSESEKRKKAIAGMIYGIIALFVMVSIWGIVNVLQETFHVGGQQTITPPSVNGLH